MQQSSERCRKKAARRRTLSVLRKIYRFVREIAEDNGMYDGIEERVLAKSAAFAEHISPRAPELIESLQHTWRVIR